MDCESLTPLIDAHADGEPSPEAEAHLADCAACRSRLAEAQQLTAALATGLAEEAPSADAARRLQHRIASEVRSQARTRARRPSPVRLETHRRRGAPLLAAAAALLAVAVPVAWMLREQPAPDVTPELPPVAAAQVPEPADLPAVEALLAAERMPTDGVAENITHFQAMDNENGIIAVAGLEPHGASALLRSAVVAPEHRDQTRGLLEQVVQRLGAAAHGLLERMVRRVVP